jgi:uncharacterized metal-binding protein YceD (DUF177 family)
MTEQTPPPQTATFTRPLELARLPKNAPYRFEIEADAAERTALARLFDAQSVRKLRFSGQLTPLDGEGWQLDGEVGATIIQSCVISLAPVTTRIDLPVRRRFLPEALLDPENDETEPLAPLLDLAHIAAEATSLALPDYPKAPDATLQQRQFTAPGVAPLTDEDVLPFAGLKALRDKLSE